MAANSPYSGYLAIAETDRIADGGPVGIDEVRACINNALWAVDYAGQTRICWIVNDSAHERTRDGTGGGSSVDEWYTLFYQHIDVHMKSGGAYSFRCRLGGRSTQAASGNAVFRLCIDHPEYVRTTIVVADTADVTNVMEETSSSGTHAWLNDEPAVLTVPYNVVRDRIVQQQTQQTIGGSLTSIPVCRLAVLVQAKVTNVGTAAGLSGVVVQEFHG